MILTDNAIKEKAGDKWSAMATVVQALAVGCVVFAGLRYMFSSADQKADIKKGMIYLAVGATLIFSAVLVVRFVVTVARNVMK